MTDRQAPRLTVGSLVGMPLGRVRDDIVASPVRSAGAEHVDELEGPDWKVDGGEVTRGPRTAWRADGIESLTFNNPFNQVMERVWFDGKVVFAVDLGAVVVDANKVKVAQEYQPVYAAKLGDDGRAIGAPERVEGQLNIYDTVPGMDRYSPIWQFNYVIVPRDYRVNSLRSEGDCLASGYPILRSQDFEN